MNPYIEISTVEGFYKINVYTISRVFTAGETSEKGPTIFFTDGSRIDPNITFKEVMDKIDKAYIIPGSTSE